MEDLLVGFIGTISALAVSKTVERYVVRKLEAADLARDAVVDWISAMTSVENALPSLVTSPVPSAYCDLSGHAAYSGWDVSLPAISRERLLSLFDEEEIHGLAILYFDRAEHFQLRAAEHRDAFYWLLDHPKLSWQKPQAAERVECLKATRSSLAECARDMLRFGYQLAERLARHAAGFNPTRWNRPPLERFLQSKFGFDYEGVRLRRAYYSLYQVPRPFDPSSQYRRLIWDDSVAARALPVRGTLVLDARHAETLESWLLPPMQEVALPNSAVARLVSGRVGWKGATTELRHARIIPAAKTYGAGWHCERVALHPEDQACIARHLPP